VEGQRERCRLHVVVPVGRVEHRAGERLLGQSPQGLWADPDDTSALPLGHAVAGRHDDAGDVHTERERRLGHHGRDPASAAGDVAEVQRRSRHPDAHLAGARLGDIDVLHLDRLAGLSLAYDSHGSHAHSPGQVWPPAQGWDDQRIKRA